MWKVPSRKQVAEKPAPPASSTTAAVTHKISSVGHPETTLIICAQRGRGYVFTLTDSLARDVTTPTIPNESIIRALEGSPVLYRNGGYSVEMIPMNDLIKIKCVSPNGLPIEGAFNSAEIEQSMKIPTIAPRAAYAYGR